MVALMRKMQTYGFPQRIYLNKLRRATTRLTRNSLPRSLPSPSANCWQFRLVFGSCPHVVKTVCFQMFALHLVFAFVGKDSAIMRSGHLRSAHCHALIANANANLQAEFTVQLRPSRLDNLVRVQLPVQSDGGGVNMGDKQKRSEK